MQVGDLVVLNYQAETQLPGWYKKMWDTRETALVVAIRSAPHGQSYAEILYDGEIRIIMIENTTVVSTIETR